MKQLEAFIPLSPAEEKLVAESVSMARVSVGDGELPDTETPENAIRAAVLRALIVGGSLTEKGLRLRGAWITGPLDLQGVRTDHDLSLSQCHLSAGIEMVNARLQGLFLSGCMLSGIFADHATFEGSVYIRAGCRNEGEISLAGAQIDGDFQLCDTRLFASRHDALFAPALRVHGSMFLGNYTYAGDITHLHAEGRVFLSSLRVENDVFITNCAISPQNGSAGDPVFAATEEHGRDIALSLARAKVGGILYLKDNQITGGSVNLAGAHVARLRDEPEAPGAAYPIRLDGLTYDDFSRHAEMSVGARLKWLARRPEDTPFTAQPYEQLARVLGHMGHRNDARTILMEKEKLLRRENRAQVASVGARWVAMAIRDGVMRWGVGYGYRPGRALLAAVVMVIGLGVFFDAVWKAGDMTPNAAPILISNDWITATETHPDNPALHWAQIGQAGQDWETFNGFAYAADVVIPIVSLGQEDAWAPSTSRSDLGRIAWWMRWFAKAAGWVITALGAAAITGAVRQE